jgi:hypothetical protein
MIRLSVFSTVRVFSHSRNGGGVLSLLFVLHPHLYGWRWAVMRATEAELLAEPTRRCVNAGFAVDRADADDRGQLALYTVLAFAASLNLSCPVTAVELDHDPLTVDETQLVAVQVTDSVLQIGGN